uniref:LOB domain-containing protein n=1 Tax=Leersia perrieri TaxID=77586 RepID=A0A0D9XB57_9ORYZ
MAGNGTPCASCKLLQRQCMPDSVFMPYFPAEKAQQFARVHCVFGAINVSKMLHDVLLALRADVVSSLVYEATVSPRGIPPHHRRRPH